MNTLPNWIKWSKEQGKYIIIESLKNEINEQEYADQKLAEDMTDYNREAH